MNQIKSYILLDGHTINATNSLEFVKLLRKSSFFPTDSLTSYLSEFAKRTYIIYGSQVRTESADDFVQDLLNLKILYISEFN